MKLNWMIAAGITLGFTACKTTSVGDNALSSGIEITGHGSYGVFKASTSPKKFDFVVVDPKTRKVVVDTTAANKVEGKYPID